MSESELSDRELKVINALREIDAFGHGELLVKVIPTQWQMKASKGSILTKSNKKN